jgi:membrane protease YdiL (CAAX protease family)
MTGPQVQPYAPAGPPLVPWTLRDVLVAVVVTAAWIGGLAGLALLTRVPYSRIDPSLLVILFELPLLVPILLLARRKYNAGWATLGFRPFKGIYLLAGCGLLLVLYGFNLAFALLLFAFGLEIPNVALGLLDQGASPWLLLFSASTVPVLEELLFRGFFFAGLRKYYGWKIAALVSGALFGLAHVSPLAFVPLTLYGIIFAALYEVSGSVWPSVIFHVINNAVAVGVIAGVRMLQG